MQRIEPEDFLLLVVCAGLTLAVLTYTAFAWVLGATVVLVCLARVTLDSFRRSRPDGDGGSVL